MQPVTLIVIGAGGRGATYAEYAIHHPEEISRFLVHEGFPPARLTVEEEDLESYFLRIIETKGEMIQ